LAPKLAEVDLHVNCAQPIRNSFRIASISRSIIVASVRRRRPERSGLLRMNEWIIPWESLIAARCLSHARSRTSPSLTADESTPSRPAKSVLRFHRRRPGLMNRSYTENLRNGTYTWTVRLHFYYIKEISAAAVIFIARQHVMHAERDIVVPILSVCLSNGGIVSKQNRH